MAVLAHIGLDLAICWVNERLELAFFLSSHPLWSRSALSVICFWLFAFFWWTIQQPFTRLRTSLRRRCCLSWLMKRQLEWIISINSDSWSWITLRKLFRPDFLNSFISLFANSSPTVHKYFLTLPTPSLGSVVLILPIFSFSIVLCFVFVLFIIFPRVFYSIFLDSAWFLIGEA